MQVRRNVLNGERRWLSRRLRQGGRCVVPPLLHSDLNRWVNFTALWWEYLTRWPFVLVCFDFIGLELVIRSITKSNSHIVGDPVNKGANKHWFYPTLNVPSCFPLGEFNSKLIENKWTEFCKNISIFCAEPKNAARDHGLWDPVFHLIQRFIR